MATRSRILAWKIPWTEEPGWLREHTKRLTLLGREEKGEGGDRGDLVKKKESQKKERVIRPVISLPSKNGY